MKDFTRFFRELFELYTSFFRVLNKCYMDVLPDKQYDMKISYPVSFKGDTGYFFTNIVHYFTEYIK
jgi:hypothetical protein